MAIVINKLNNGIPIIIEELSQSRSVTFGVYVGSGSANETKENNGVAHAIEHMLFKGTKSFTSVELADAMTEMGGGVNAYTSRENTVFYGKVLQEDFDKAMMLISDMMKNSLFDEKEFNKEKHVIIDEIDSYDDSAEDVCHELLQKRVWKDNSLGFIISGNKSNVKKLTREQLVEFLNNNYTADNIVISLAGKVDEGMTEEVLEKYFCDIPLKSNKLLPLRPEFNRCFITKFKDMEQVHLNLAFDNVHNDHKDRYAMYMVNSLLGGNLNSRLFQKVREEHGLTYSIYSYNSLSDIAGLFHIYASMIAFQVKKVLEIIIEIIDDLNKNGITEKELEALKKQTKTELILGSEAPSGIVVNNAKTYLSNGRVISVDEAVAEYEAVTLEQINSCIKTYLRLDKYSICMVGNTDEVDIPSIKKLWNKYI